MSIQALIIDDTPTNLSVLENALKLEGVQSFLCGHPEEIEPVLKSVIKVDLVFLDLEFPGYDGLQLIGDLKQNPTLANVPFVAYTVHTSEQNEAQAAGFHSFMGKPLNVEAFPYQLRRILEGEPVWDTGA